MLYQDVSGMPKEDYIDYLIRLDHMDWSKYDYTTWPSADLSFPDLKKGENHDLWPFRPSLDNPDWVDLNNQFTSGVIRHGYVNNFEMPDQISELSYEDAIDIFNEIWGIKNKQPVEFKDDIQEFNFSDEKHFLWAIELLNSITKEEYRYIYGLPRKYKIGSNARMSTYIRVASSGSLLDPIDGVDVNTWAAINAKVATGMCLEEVLGVVGVEKPMWKSISKEWSSRMSQDNTYTISKTYGKAFIDSDIGKFAYIEMD